MTTSESVEMAEHWDGARWTLQTTSPPPAGAAGSELLGISCPAVNSCFAIGDYHKKPGPRTRVPLAEHWDGSSWTLQPISGPPGRTYFGFNGLSCSSPQFCVAIGEYGRGLFTDTWNGTNWTAKLITRPESPAVPDLFAISCSSAKACLAVGNETAELWNGTKWQEVPPAAPKGGTMELLSVSCPSATDCEAVGIAGGTKDRSAELWNGRKWFIQTGLPTTTKSQFAAVLDVSCVSEFNCLAVGHNQPRAPGGYRPLASHYS